MSLSPILRRAHLAGALLLAATGLPAVLPAQSPRIRLDTDAGAIVVALDSARAPVTAANFLRYVAEGKYDGGTFYRVVTPRNQPGTAHLIDVVQGGIARGTKGFPPIAHETTERTGILHEDGTISMARAAPGSASGEFFVVLGRQPELDFGGRRNADGQGFAAFGRVVDGMDVVRRIHAMPTDSASPQRLATPVRIRSARVER